MRRPEIEIFLKLIELGVIYQCLTVATILMFNEGKNFGSMIPWQHWVNNESRGHDSGLKNNNYMTLHVIVPDAGYSWAGSNFGRPSPGSLYRSLLSFLHEADSAGIVRDVIRPNFMKGTVELIIRRHCDSLA